MANIRRHFNFSSKPQTLCASTTNNSDGISTQFDKRNLMNNIRSCLEMCCSYIQALNALCGAGSLLARNLLLTVQNVPAYQNVGQQFLCVWDEVSKATAGASAAVKTESLMMLQELLNTLEMSCSADDDVHPSVTDSFQVVGSCLHSFIELQAQFSMSTWKSFSKLSKSFSNDAFIHSLNRKSQERNMLKVAKNSELCSTIKKHYSHLLRKYDAQKSTEAVEVPQNQYFLPIGIENKLMNAHCTPKTEPLNSTANPNVWASSSSLWSTPVENEKSSTNSNPLSPIHINRVPGAPPELDEVINLLSCMPINNKEGSSLPPRENRGDDPPQPYQFWPPGGAPILGRGVGHQRPWSEGSRDLNFGYDSWIWRADNMNCANLPNRFPDDAELKEKGTWDNNEPTRWSMGAGESSSDDASSSQGPDFDSHSAHNFFPGARPRRYSSSDGLPDAQDLLSVTEDLVWNVHNQKTSTWPLKQQSSRFLTGPEWFEALSDSKCVPIFYSGPNS